MANQGRERKPSGGLEQYMKESARGFKECRVKNSQLRNSLQKKTLGIRKQRNISTLLLDKEERELREKYRQLKDDQKVSSFTTTEEIKDKVSRSEGLAREADLSGDRNDESVVLNPYPITFQPPTKTRNERKKTTDALETQERVDRI